MEMKHLAKLNNQCVRKLPPAWRGLFLALSSANLPEEKADIWYRESTESHYGHKPMWSNILLSLLIMDPYIDSQSSSLQFKPRLLQLLPELQERFLKFCLCPSYLIPDRDIQYFVRSLASQLSIDSHLYNLLRQLMRITKDGDKLERELFQDTPVDKVTAQGLRGDQTCNSLPQDASSGNPQKTTSSEHDTGTRPGNTDTTDIDVIVLDDEDDHINVEPVAKRQKLDHDGTQENGQNATDINTSQAVVQELNTTDVNTCTGLNSDAEKRSDILVCFSQHKEEALTQLRDIWHNRVSHPDPTLLQTLSTFSPEEMKIACNRLDLSNMSEVSIATACKHLATVSDFISYNSCTNFLTYTLSAKIKELVHNASQVIIGAVTLIAETFPKQLIDSVFVPVVTNSPTVPQCELICRVIQDTLSSGSRNYLIQKMVDVGFHTSDSEIIVLQSLVDNQSEFTDAILLKLVTIMEASSTELVKNIKFGKLLLGVVNKHGKVLSGGTVAKLANIVDRHETFLKKSIEARLKKLKF